MPQEIIDIRAKQLKDWIDNGHLTPEQLAEIQAIWNEE